MSLRIGDFLGRSVVRRILVFAVVALLYSGFATAKASAYPFTTTSYYESTTSTSTLQTQGCNAGGASASGVIILDFGRPAYNAGAYGTILFGSGGFSRAAGPGDPRNLGMRGRGVWKCQDSAGGSHSSFQRRHSYLRFCPVGSPGVRCG